MNGPVLDGAALVRQVRRVLVPDEDRRLERQLARAAHQQAQAELARRRAHEAAVRRQERARRRARAQLPVHGTLSVGAALAVVPLDGGWEAGAVGLAGFSLLRCLRGLQALRLPPVAPAAAVVRTPLPAPPPPSSSAAFAAVRRLETVRGELARLLPLVSPVGRELAEQTWSAAGQADAALRWQAYRLAAVEPHRGADPELMGPLYAGVQRQESVVVAVADLVAASADPWAHQRLQEATDALYGLAQGLREMRGRPA